MQPVESKQHTAVNSRQTLQGTDMDIKELAPALAHRTCNRYKHGDEWPYQFTEQGVIDFATRLIAAYLAEQEEVVRVVDGGGELHLPKLQWVSANHSLETPIGSKLFTAPPLPAIPDGCVVVPRVPTKEMVAASWNAAGSVRFGDGQEKYIAVAYQAMIAVGEVK